MGRILGFDFGLKRIGVAISDPSRTIASPLETIERKDTQQDARRLARLVHEHEAERLVVGLPIHTTGRESQLARLAREWGRWAAEVTRLPVSFIDERYTSIEAEDLMLQSGLKRQKRKALRDQLAARILLQDYLDAGCPEVDSAPLPIADPPDEPS
jgi:putative Holliday junction resolvase